MKRAKNVKCVESEEDVGSAKATAAHTHDSMKNRRDRTFGPFLQLFRGRTAHCFRLARDRLTKALQFVKTVRETRRRDMYALWDTRIQSACEEHGLYSAKALYEGLAQANIPLNRNMLHTLLSMNRALFSIILRLLFKPWKPSFYYSRLKDDKRPIRCGPLDGDVDAFLQDFSSRLWFTYRGAFEPMSLPAPIQSDAQVGSPLTSTAEFRRSISLNETPPVIPTTTSTTVYASWTVRPQHRKVRNGTASQSVASSSPPRIPLSLRTSDAGWGCMLRSGQMLLAQALIIHFLGRNWVYSRKHNHPASHPSSWYHRQIIRWFGDTPAASSPFSIHRLVQASGSPPGACLGPATLCRALVIAMALAGQTEPLLREIEIYLARDRVICTEEVLDLFNNCTHPSPSSDGEGYSFTDHTGNYRPAETNEPETCQPPAENQRSPHLSITSTSSVGSFLLVDPLEVQADAGGQSSDPVIQPQAAASATPIHPPAAAPPRRGLFLLVPMRLGAGSRIDSLYTSTFLHLLRDPACVGAVGGRPRHSVYMTGSQNDRLIYLDPHLYQETVSVEGRFFNPSSWHCSTPRLMPIKHLDPSCAFGFYCGSRMELVQLLERLPRISELRSPHRSNTRLIEVVSASQASSLFSPPVTSLSAAKGASLTKDFRPSYSYPPIDDSGEQFYAYRQHCEERDAVIL